MDVAMLGEADVVARAVSGDRTAFGELYERHRVTAFGAAYSVLGDAQEAWDVAHDAFEQALRAIRSFHHEAPFGAWIHRIARNAALDECRRRSRRPRVYLLDSPGRIPDPGAVSMIDQVAMRDAIAGHVQWMSTDWIEVLRLKLECELSNIEIAHLTRRTEGAVKQVYHRILARLREDLDTP